MRDPRVLGSVARPLERAHKPKTEEHSQLGTAQSSPVRGACSPGRYPDVRSGDEHYADDPEGHAGDAYEPAAAGFSHPAAERSRQ